MRRLILIALALVLVLSVPGSQPARALRWTQTSDVDFQGGRLTNVTTLPSGDMQLDTVPAWFKTGVVLTPTPGWFDASGAYNQFAMKDGATYRMWYRGFDGSRFRILYATSADGVSWTKQSVAINVLVPPYNFDSAASQFVMKEGTTYKMWFGGGVFSGPFGMTTRIYYATSTDAASWTIVGVALDVGPTGSWDGGSVFYPTIVRDTTGTYWMYYAAWDGTPPGTTRIGVATSTTGATFTKPFLDPILSVGSPGSWEDRGLNMPFVQAAPPRILWYSAGGTVNRAGYATSTDGFSWTKVAANPILLEGPSGAWDSRGAYSTSFLSDGGAEWMYFTGTDGTTSRIGRAQLVSGYKATGTFESVVFDSGGTGSVWNTLFANGTVPGSTSLTLRTRSGDVPLPDLSWSAWSAPNPPGTSPIGSPRARYIQVRADFLATNVSRTPVLHDFTVDYTQNSASEPTLLSPIDGEWVNTTGLRVSWIYSDLESDPQAGFHVQISDRSDFATIASESGDVLSADTFWRAPPLPDGDWYWRVRTLDAQGTWSPYPSAAYVRIDTRPPTTFDTETSVHDYVGGVPVFDSSSRVALNSADTGSGVATTYVVISGAPPAMYLGAFLPVGHGQVSLDYWSTDLAGNVERPKTVGLLLDNAPSVILANPANGNWTNSPRLTLGWTYTDPDGDPANAYEVQLATNSSFSTLAYSSGQVSGDFSDHTFPGVADGMYLWRVRSADALGVWSPFSPPATVHVDTGLPAVTQAFSASLGTVDGRNWISPETTFTLNATDAESGVADIFYSIDGGTALRYGAPVALSSHGIHAVAYWAVDTAGNVGPTGRAEVLIDQPPSVANREPEEEDWAAQPTRLVWDFTDLDGDHASAHEVQVSTDPSFSTLSTTSGVVDSSTPDWQVPALADGSYVWRVRVKDTLDVWSGWSSPTRIRVDATPPRAEALHDGSPLPASTTRFALYVDDTITLNATDAGSGVARIEYSLDGGAWTNYASAISFADAGRHVLMFRAIDNAGNTAPVSLVLVDVKYPVNWTPLVALVFAIVLAFVGGVLVSRRKELSAKPTRRLAWTVMALPGTALEAVVGFYSLVTGELAILPWLGAGLVTILAVAVVGFASIAIGARALAVQTPTAEGEKHPEEPQE